MNQAERINVKMIVAEDNSDDAELLMRVIRKNSFPVDVLHFMDGEQVLDYFGFDDEQSIEIKKPVIPALVLLDLKMPKVDGLTVLSKIKSEKYTKNTPVVILTSSNQERDIRAAYEAGANAYLVKPVDYFQFQAAVESMVNFWLKTNIILP